LELWIRENIYCVEEKSVQTKLLFEVSRQSALEKFEGNEVSGILEVKKEHTFLSNDFSKN
jgi:hypothetical protein